jgi:hypothetical protein
MTAMNPIYGSENQPAQSAPVPLQALRLGNQSAYFALVSA